MAKFDSRSFRQWCGSFTTGVTVVSIIKPDGKATGITVNSFSSVSLEPPLVLFCLERAAHEYPAYRKASHFAINVLSESQEFLSRYFADQRHHAVPDNIWDRPQKGCPILRHTLGWMVCKRHTVHTAGDHDIFVGKVVSLHRRTGMLKPLLYFHSRYRKIAD